MTYKKIVLARSALGDEAISREYQKIASHTPLAMTGGPDVLARSALRDEAISREYQ
jgi:hypothetical protein